MFQDRGGVIVNISATLAYRGQAFQTHSGSAKAAVGKLQWRHHRSESGTIPVTVGRGRGAANAFS